jgi:hypothetical protein
MADWDLSKFGDMLKKQSEENRLCREACLRAFQAAETEVPFGPKAKEVFELVNLINQAAVRIETSGVPVDLENEARDNLIGIRRRINELVNELSREGEARDSLISIRRRINELAS